MIPQQNHATVIGAGPAGAVAALVLARDGWRVTLVEQHRFPRDKVCGECLSALGLEVLARLGVRDAIEALYPAMLRRTILHAADGTSSSIRLPRAMWGISRRVLDTILLDAARAAGAEVLQPARCERIESGPSGVIAQCRDLRTNQVQSIGSEFVLVADGKAALGLARPRGAVDLGIKAHFAGIDGPRDAIELFGVAGHYGGLAPIEDERWNLAFSIPIARVNRYGADIDSLFAVIASENRSLRRRLQGARRLSPWLAAPLPRFTVSNHWPRGVIPIGNAASSIEPIGGEGMGLAMRSAEVAARMLIQAIRRAGGFEPSRLQSKYRNLWKIRAAACRASALAISSPTYSRALVRASRFAPLASIGLGAIGKIGYYNLASHE